MAVVFCLGQVWGRKLKSHIKPTIFKAPSGFESHFLRHKVQFWGILTVWHIIKRRLNCIFWYSLTVFFLFLKWFLGQVWGSFGASLT